MKPKKVKNLFLPIFIAWKPLKIQGLKRGTKLKNKLFPLVPFVPKIVKVSGIIDLPIKFGFVPQPFHIILSPRYI
jgi:hypothetical protein